MANLSVRHSIAAGALILSLILHAVVYAKSEFPCRKWPTLSDETKIAIIQKVIDLNKANGVTISLPVRYYVDELNRLVQIYFDTKNEEALDGSVGVTFHTIAAMEGDWGNGESKVEHAKKWMGEWFDTFKRLNPSKYEHLIQLDRESSGSSR